MTPVHPFFNKNVEELFEVFDTNLPFRHLVLDSFLDESFCQGLVENFPSFSNSNSFNESGLAGGKAVDENLKDIGAQYRELDALFSSVKFRHFLSGITGVHDLLYDPYYYGGGTHENLSGQELDPHIDFNYHPNTGSHRRLNLILYLNKEWRRDWGGNLELHSDPRSGDGSVIEIEPIFNRMVIFETTEHSWHGFKRIALPNDLSQMSRKSIALYYYSATRPEAETAAEHSTVYIDRPIPETIIPGQRLTPDDYHELKQLITRRDHHISRLYKEKEALTQQVSRLSSILEKVKRYAGPLLWIKNLLK